MTSEHVGIVAKAARGLRTAALRELVLLCWVHHRLADLGMIRIILR